METKCLMLKEAAVILMVLLQGLTAPNYLQAQVIQEKTLVRIEMKDGNEFIGTIESESESEVVLKTERLGLITIKREDIRSVKEIPSEHIVSGEYWAPNPQSGRHFWSPTGYGLKQGEGYYQNLWVFFNQVSYGISNNFTIGVGIMPLFLFGAGATPIWITPKFSVPLEKESINLGGGVIIATVLGEDSPCIGIAYGLTTFGNRDRNLSIGLGWGFIDNDFAKTPTINVSGILRTGRRGYLVTENYFISAGGENVLILSFGGRTLWNRFSLDYGLFRPVHRDLGNGFIAFPWLGFVVPFSS
jgi:hypothetical protein